MFSFFSKKSRPEKIGMLLQTDMHAHLIPGVDDGAPDLEAALVLVRGMEELGYKKLIATPHIYWDLYKNNKATLQPGFEALREAIKKEGIAIELGLAAEYMMDEYFEELVAKKEQLLTIHENKVLIEFPFVSAPIGWKEKLFDLQINGYQPVMAHPERYAYAHKDKSFYASLIDAGCLLQLNLLSVSGYYGPGEQAAARYLLKNNMISFAGTDCHHERHLSRLFDPAISTVIQGYGTLMNESLS